VVRSVAKVNVELSSGTQIELDDFAAHRFLEVVEQRQQGKQSVIFKTSGVNIVLGHVTCYTVDIDG
jgi:hypothetical protein